MSKRKKCISLFSNKYILSFILVMTTILLIFLFVLFIGNFKKSSPTSNDTKPFRLGGKTTIDISNDHKFQKIIGEEYITQIDLVIHNRNRDFEEYLLSPPFGFTFPTLEEIKNMPELPYDYNQFHRIHGILPSKNAFKIVKVLKHRQFKLGRAHDSLPLLQGEILSEGKFKGYRVLLHNLTNLEFYDPGKKNNINTLIILKKYAIKKKR